MATPPLPQEPAIPAEPGFRPTYAESSAIVNGREPIDISEYPGRLISLEGTDGVGRSTHIALLREWLETRGFGVRATGLKQGRLTGEGLRRAKDGHTLGQLAMDLFYATDFADRLEKNVLPALRAGFVVLTDRYIYSTMARSIVRGSDPRWIEDVYRFAPKPHAVFYLKIDVEHLTPRILTSGGFDYLESGMDFQEESDRYHSFVRYQTRLLKVFDELADAHDFRVLDARPSVDSVFAELREATGLVVAGMEGVSP